MQKKRKKRVDKFSDSVLKAAYTAGTKKKWELLGYPHTDDSVNGDFESRREINLASMRAVVDVLMRGGK